jgi:hypothetical protein
MRRLTLTLAILACAVASPLAAEPTALSVHVLAHDAKFIGDSMGGVRISIRDLETGEMLAQGVTRGGTGDTELIMVEPRQRGASLVTEDAAGFSTSLDLDAPRRVEISALGPLDHPGSANSVTVTQWLLPGKDVDPLILEMPGLVVTLHELPALLRLQNGEVSVPVAARVEMMCGCPLTPDGHWDSDEFEITARLLRDGLPVTGAVLGYAGESSEFEGHAVVTQPGRYEVLVRAHQPRTGNSGVARGTVVVD